jgi:pantoate--beta-alanine ligase
VAVIVTKLLGVVRPDVLLLGRKDAQQLAVVRRLVRDLDLGVEVVAVPTMREPDGFAMSSRNAYLTAEQRAVAPNLYRALMSGAAAGDRPGAGIEDVVVAATASLLLPEAPLDPRDRAAALRGEAPPAAPAFDLEYLAIVDPDTFEPRMHLAPGSLLIAAARLGAVRLIDNVPLTPSAYPAEDATT